MVRITIPDQRSRDFTLDKYRDLCFTLLENYTICTVRDYLSGKSVQRTAILRHDVDRRITNAVKMAELEHGMGIQSTYYFRYPYTFDPEIIRKITDLGHETGYHYEVLSKTRGDFIKAINIFQFELNAFRKICAIDTICMHGQPLSAFDNRDIWKDNNFRDYDLLGDAFLSIKLADYFSDTGRSWNGKNNLRDYISVGNSQDLPETTEDLIQLIRQRKSEVLYLNIHPERWSFSPESHIMSYGTDLLFNFGKKVIRKVRG